MISAWLRRWLAVESDGCYSLRILHAALQLRDVRFEDACVKVQAAFAARIHRFGKEITLAVFAVWLWHAE